jgi:hypothetical protein
VLCCPSIASLGGTQSLYLNHRKKPPPERILRTMKTKASPHGRSILDTNRFPECMLKTAASLKFLQPL